MNITPIVPTPYKIKKLPFAGFATRESKMGETVVPITVKDAVTSSHPRFSVYVEQLGRIIFPQIKIPVETVNRALVIIHPDESAEVYVNNFPESFQAKPAEGVTIQAGKIIYKSDLSEIVMIDFPGIEIKNYDQILYLIREGFQFGFYFNSSRDMDLKQMKKDIGKLKNELMLGDILKTSIEQMKQLEKNSYDAYIITEGKTDWKHLIKASEFLGEKLSLVFNDSTEPRGDSKLLAHCEGLSVHEMNQKPIICIFDNDNPKIIAELQKRTEEGKKYQKWGNNVYSFMLPIPLDRAGYKNISIEMLYSDAILTALDKNNKRLFFSNEIEKIISKTTNKVLPPRIVPAKNDEEFDKKVEDEDSSLIFDEQGNEMAISKAIFAEQVFSGERNLIAEDFKNFSSVFEVVKEIMEEAKI